MSTKPIKTIKKHHKSNVIAPNIESKSIPKPEIHDDENTKQISIIQEDNNSTYIEKIPNRTIKLRLNTIGNTQKSLNRVIRAVCDDSIPREKARTLGFLLRIAFDGWKVAAELTIMDKIAALEKAVKNQEKDRK